MAEIFDLDTLLATSFQPKLAFQWIVEIDGMDTFTAESIDRPKVDVGEIEMNYINTTTFIPGKAKPQSINMKFKDPIAPSQTQKAWEWMRSIYEFETGRAGYKELIKKNIFIKVLSPTGEVVEKWELKNAWVKGLTLSPLDYSSEEKLMVEFEIRYDRPILYF